MAKDQITLTQRRIANFKYFVYACVGLAIVADAAVFIVLAAYQTPVKYWIIPMLLTVADVAFLAACLFLNFRFKYSTPYLVGYAAVVVLLAGAMFLIGNDFGGGTAYTVYAHTLWPALHAVIAIAVIVAAVLSAKNGSKPKLAGAVVCIALLACSGAYGIYALGSGYFGQGATDENRLLLYSLADDGASYRVVGVESGRGNRVVVPESFDGKPVSAVDCAAFSAPGVSVVRLDCSRDIVFENESALDEVSESTRYITAKADLDYFRNKFYAAGHDRTARCMEPGDLASDEVYVTFDYDDDYLDIGKEYLSTWFGKKGDVLTLSADAAPEWYVRSDLTAAADLHLAYTARSRKIFYGFYDGEENRNNTVMGDSRKNLAVRFTDVYKVTIGSDNDDVYESPDSYKTTVVDGDTLPYRYTVADNADALVAAIPARDGFDVVWEYTGKFGAMNLDLLSAVLGSSTLLPATDVSSNSVTISPVWMLRAPTMTDLTGAAMPTYGDKVTYSSVVTGPADNIDLSYKWTRDGAELDSTENSYTNDCIDIDEDGVYTLTVTAYSEGNAVTSLISYAVKEINVTVQKRTLHFDWSELENDVYDGTDKAISATYRDADVVTMDGVKDVIDYTTTYNTLKNAGTTLVNVVLGEDCEAKYALDLTYRHSYTIQPKALTLSVNAGITKVFDNALFDPENDDKFAYTADGLVAGEELGDPTFTVVDPSVNVGKYSVQVSFPDATDVLRNYALMRRYGTAEITARPISFTWSNDTFTYNGLYQHPTVTADAAVGDTGIAPGDAEGVGNYISYVNGNNRDADEYEVEIFVNNGNYKFKDGQVTSKRYVIDPKPVTLVWEDEDEGGGYSYTYTGANHAHGPVVVEIPELVDADKGKNIALFVTETGKESQASATPYTVTASLLTTGAAKNYTLSGSAVTTKQYYVNKHNIEAVWNNNRSTTFTYNGDTQSIFVTGFRSAVYSNGHPSADIVRTETAQILAAITYGDTNSRKDVGSQTATATLDHNNYTLKPLNYDGVPGGGPTDTATTTLTIEQKSVTVTATSVSKIYDGTAYTQADLSYTHNGLVAADIDKLQATYSSTAIGDKNAATAALTVTLGDKAGQDVVKNYAITYTPGNIIITPASLVIVWDTNSFVYNASAQRPTATIGASTQPVSGDTVNITYSGDTAVKNVGNYTVTAAFDNSNYIVREINNSKSVWSFSIRRATVSIAWTESPSYTYNGSAQGPVPTVTVDPSTITDFYEVTYAGVGNSYNAAAAPINAGSYRVSVTLTDIANLQFAAGAVVQKTFAIDKKEVNITWNAYDGDYDGAAHMAEIAAVTGAINDTDAATLKDTLNANRTGSRTNADDTAVTTTSLTHTNYCLSASAPSGSVTVNKKAVNITWTPYTGDYDGAAHMATVATVTGALRDDTQSLLTLLNANRTGSRTNADDTAVTTTTLDHRNYALSASAPSGSVTVNKKAVDIAWTMYQGEYDGEAHMATVATVTGAINAADAQALLAALNANRTGSRTNVADTAVTTTSLTHRNYALSDSASNGKISINQRIISLVWNDYVGVYDGEAHMAEIVDISRAIEKDKAALLTELNNNRTGSRTNVDDTGFTSTHFTNSTGNYQLLGGSPNGQVTITPAIVTVTWTESASYTYNGAAQGPAPTVTVEPSTLTGYYTVTYSGTDNGYSSGTRPTNAGAYKATVTLTDAVNYAFAPSTVAEKTFTVTPAELSVVWKNNGVAVTEVELTEGEAYVITAEGSVADVELTVKYVGAGDTEYAESATAPTVAGTYTATVSTDNGNYRIALNSATITITITAATAPEPEQEA